ncbi:putative transmembrane protein [Toxoplasma gondii RUB]|uniref:Transmembrane protein n=2 Tax=Toxoplasma gondii TaxID=5811 RepID=A0A139XWK3_TOXGO|nr:putative transmembrane protein [Toxoplasma gondii RUB]KYF43168.1 hypothetical protein TGARI_363700 [Toxoplasma gondii ARI]
MTPQTRFPTIFYRFFRDFHHPPGILKTATCAGLQHSTTLRLFHIGYVPGAILGLLLSLVSTTRPVYYSDAITASTIVRAVTISRVLFQQTAATNRCRTIEKDIMMKHN